MKFPALACLLALGLSSASWAAPPAASPNPAAALPQWAQDKLAAAKADPKAYERAYKQGAKLATFCANCHGTAGQSVRPDVPNLAGQNTIYVLDQLNQFHDGRRRNAFFMEGLVKAMSNEERFAVAVYFTNQEPPRPQSGGDAKLAAQGKAVYESGCRTCHGADGVGSERNARLAGQQPGYLETSIRRYRDNGGGAGDPKSRSTRGLSDADIKALVAYIGALR